jgi:hypothetical protein
MPRRRSIVMPLLAGLGACAPAAFTWHDDPAGLADYHGAFAAAAGDRFVATATQPELLAHLATARVLWLGDHHDSAALHDCQRLLLPALLRTARPLAFVLEAIGEQDEPAVASYLAREIDARTLRERMRARWPDSWLDDPQLDRDHYRAVLEFAREHDVHVHGLERTPRAPLAERDAAMAARVRAIARAEADRLVVVFVGQTHLLGHGDVIARCGEPAVAIGGEPTPSLVAAAPSSLPEGSLLRSDGGLWWFAALLARRR